MKVSFSFTWVHSESNFNLRKKQILSDPHQFLMRWRFCFEIQGLHVLTLRALYAGHCCKCIFAMELSKGLYKIVVKRDTDQLANIIEFNLKFLPNLYFVHNLFTLLVAFHMFSLITFKFESSKSNFIFIIVADMTNLIPSANSTKFKHVGNILISHVSPATCLH